MNKRKGFFRLTLVLSILIGIATPPCHNWIFEKSEVNGAFPDDWSKRSLQEKLNSIDRVLSINNSFLLLPKIERLNIRRQLKEQIISDAKIQEEWEKTTLVEGKKRIVDPLDVETSKRPIDSLAGRYFISFKPGWRELTFLAIVGSASPWLIYLFIRWVIVAFIVGGFRTGNKTQTEAMRRDEEGRILEDVSIPGKEENLKRRKEIKFSEKCIVFVKKWWGFGTILMFVFGLLYYILSICLMVRRR